MMITQTPAKRELLIAELDSLTPPELFDLCGQRTKDELTADFAETLDADDVGDLVETVKANKEAKVAEMSLKLHGMWGEFLDGRNIRNEYADEVERNFLSQREDD